MLLFNRDFGLHHFNANQIGSDAVRQIGGGSVRFKNSVIISIQVK